MKTRETPETADQQVCTLCYKKHGLYTCPRCNIRYCSSGCYKSEAHAQCSEAFYKSCFMEGLREIQNEPCEKEKMLEMLQRFEDENQPGDGEGEDLAERLECLDLDSDTDKIWHKLTPSERREFHKMLEDGQLGNMVELWEPWWTKPSLVEEVGVEAVSKPSVCPKMVDSVGDIDTLFKGSPSDSIKYSIVNLLYGYAYICRLYNGDQYSVVDESVANFLAIARAVGKRNFENSTEAVESSMHVAADQKKSLSVSKEFSVGILQDVIKLIKGPGLNPLAWIQASISDAHSLVKKAKKSVDKRIKKHGDKAPESLKNKKQQLFQACKKLEFFLSWTIKYGACLTELVPELELLWCSASTELARSKEDAERRSSQRKVGHDAATKPSKLVEEI